MGRRFSLPNGEAISTPLPVLPDVTNSDSKPPIAMKPLFVALLNGALVLSLAGCMHGVNADYAADRKQLDAEYKSARAQCDGLTDVAKEVCKAQAQAGARTGRAELEQHYAPSAKHQRDLDEARAKSTHAVARAHCDDAKGEARRSCIQQARSDYDQAMDAIRATRY